MAPARKRQLKLGYSIWPTGHHRTAWRLPEADNSGTVDPAFMRDTIQTAERGLFDYYFIGNAVKSDPEAARANGNEVFKIEGYALGGYAAALTKKIGIVVTINITYSDPYNTARAIASLDHLSGGRTGLNVVTGAAGTDANFNFSRDIHPQAEDKYAQADEFLDVFNRLIGSWDEDWLVDDRINGVFLDPAKAHRLDHVGRFFSVRGPLNIPKTPQSRIPIIHAGTSEQSFELGAKYADVRFSPYRGRDWNQAYYSHIKGLLPKYDRKADDQLVLPGFTFFVDETSRSAHDKYREVQDFTLNEYAPQLVSKFLGIDLNAADAREKVLDVIDLDKLEAKARTQKPQLTGMPGQSPDKSWVLRGALEAYGDPEHVTFNDLYRYIVNFPGNQSPVVGGAKEVADWIEERFENREFDGVKIFPPYSPQPLAAFVDLVVPELQRRGIYRTEYDSSTLLGHLGLDADQDQGKTA